MPLAPTPPKGRFTIPACTTTSLNATLPELVAERLHERPLPAGVDREHLVSLGLRYLQQAEDAALAALPVLEG